MALCVIWLGVRVAASIMLLVVHVLDLIVTIHILRAVVTLAFLVLPTLTLVHGIMYIVMRPYILAVGCSKED